MSQGRNDTTTLTGEDDELKFKFIIAFFIPAVFFFDLVVAFLEQCGVVFGANLVSEKNDFMA